jgi:putative endonuclease
VGITPDLCHRVKLHNLGKAAQHTRDYGPVTLVYFKQYINKSEARKREIQIKGWSRSKKGKLIHHEYE